MNVFGPQLEPGERVELRQPPVWAVATLAVLFAGVATAPVVTDLLHGRGIAGGTLAPHLALGAIMLLAVLFFFGLPWALVTDRRVLVRPKLGGGPVAAIPRADIEAAYLINATLFIEGKGRIISTFCLALFAKPLLKRIDPLYDNLKLRTPGLRKRLKPGERVVLRLRRPILSVLAWTAMPALPLVVMMLLLAHPDAVNALLRLFSGLMAFVVFFLFLVILQLSFDISWFGVFFDHWRVAVTDRRILARRGILGTRHDEMDRHEIETLRYEPAARHLSIAGDGREIAVRCGRREARRILDALGRPEISEQEAPE